PIAACVTNLQEANDFLGRNLETGERFAKNDFGKESTAVIAARHGMSEGEYLFYSKLAAEAVQQDILSRPESATITIVNGDGVGEGFNDPSVRVPEGGNNGITLGQQRLNLFNNAAAIWGAFLDSSSAIKVNAQFNVLTPCSTSGGVLGSAGTNYTAANFANAQFANTDYHVALANKQAGSDLTGGLDLISARFNTDVDNACLGAGTRFYYGLDNSTPSNTINLLVVLLHELGHGLGFSSFATTITLTSATNASPIVVTSNTHGLANGDQVTVTGATGNTAANGTWTVANRTANTFELQGSVGNGAYTANSATIRGVYRNGRPDVWSRFMFDRTTSKFWNNMTTAERSASGINTNNLLWDGSNIKIASGTLTAGRDAATGRVEMYTPNPFQQGSSVSHWNTAAAPNLLMEPAINTGLPLDLDFTRQLMRDIGWYRDVTSDLTADTITGVTPNGGGAVIGTTRTITWVNNGGFNRNVRIELSTDGGTTFPTVIASSVANTGSYSGWTVPNSPTSTARIRVREADFANPVGVSSANFTISLTPLAAGAEISGRVTDANGRAISRATVVLNGPDGVARTATSNGFGYFVFVDVPVGESYLANVRSKRYQFEPRLINLADNFAGLDFIAQ
ncbi:MAG: carboxypeptidase regulatory-like domain-containing protein, partial [Acidobacteria bacterium]|nr:carboxypeptidase regulatory-like domain-containing protein [Acidobacteriota bacterium]